MNRSEQLKNVRPTIEIDNTKSSEPEVFRGKTLRPVLKFQNDLIISLFNNHLSEHKFEVKNLTESKKIEHVNHTLKNNLQLKQLLLGSVIGQFTDDELAYYYLNKKETSKQIVALLIERICSQLESINF